MHASIEASATSTNGPRGNTAPAQRKEDSAAHCAVAMHAAHVCVL